VTDNVRFGAAPDDTCACGAGVNRRANTFKRARTSLAPTRQPLPGLMCEPTDESAGWQGNLIVEVVTKQRRTGWVRRCSDEPARFRRPVYRVETRPMAPVMWLAHSMV